jgi:hypothetical protein
MTQKKRPRWYDDPRVAIVISLVGFVLSVFPTWYPIISDWINSNFVGMVYAFDSIANPVLPMKTGISVGNSANRDAWKKVCISTSLYIEITNNTSHRLSIQGFEIQQESSEGKWVTLPEASLSPPYIVELSTPDLGAASYFDYSSNYFDKLIKSTTLETGVKLQGWTFLLVIARLPLVQGSYGHRGTGGLRWCLGEKLQTDQRGVGLRFTTRSAVRHILV